MLSRHILAGAVIALALPGLAQAGFQAGPQTEPTPSTEPAPPAAKPLEIGTRVKDAQGQVIGTVTSTSDTDGGAMVVLTIDGKATVVPRSTLIQSGAEVISTQTKAQILGTPTAG
jgi:hypothetical protein